MENLKTISKHNEDYLKGIYSYFMGITSFADISDEEFLSTYLGIKDPSVLDQFKVQHKPFSFNLTYWKVVIRDCVEYSWKSIFHTIYKLFQCLCTSPLPLTIDWREQVRYWGNQEFSLMKNQFDMIKHLSFALSQCRLILGLCNQRKKPRNMWFVLGIQCCGCIGGCLF